MTTVTSNGNTTQSVKELIKIIIGNFLMKILFLENCYLPEERGLYKKMKVGEQACSISVIMFLSKGCIEIV